MSKRRNKGRRARVAPVRVSRPNQGEPQSLPSHILDEQAARLDSLTKQWKSKWPHGVDPEKMLGKMLSPIVSLYRGGNRTAELLEQMREAEEALTVPGLCTVEVE